MHIHSWLNGKLSVQVRIHWDIFGKVLSMFSEAADRVQARELH